MIIGIVGLTGSGKSTIATIIAKHKGCALFDMDIEFSEEYKDRNRKGEVVPAEDVKRYQRNMIERLLVLQEGQVIVLAGFFLDDEIPLLIESQTDVVWINLVTESYTVLEGRLNARKGHFATGVPALVDNWPMRHKQVFGSIKVDCAQSIKKVVEDCLSYM